MATLSPDDPLARAAVEAIHGGDVERLRRLLAGNPGLATARIAGDDEREGGAITRTLLHVATDWPGHFRNGVATVAALIDAGAEVDARNTPNTETPLHWAASNGDVAVLDALLDAGADVEAPGAVIAGGTPLDDAVAFGEWPAARRLVERGAETRLWHAAALGLTDRIESHFSRPVPPAPHPWGASTGEPPDEVTVSFWAACHGGQREAAAYLLERGAELNWVSAWDGLTPLDAAEREGADDVVEWLRARGGKSAAELG
jgi:ankyrin repeat protein